MKKISYFGKEYTVGDDIKWVVTCSSGNVLAFTEFPRLYCGTWVSHEDGKRIGIWGGATNDWENSLRKVEDIIVKENKLKIGEFKIKCIDNKGSPLFKVGNEYRAWYEGMVLCSDSEFTTSHHSSLDSPYGVFEVVGQGDSHQHADLMLKYAQIAQYDDKPWESFECNSGGENWYPMVSTGFFDNFNYRLKPQGPKIQVGQIWVSKEGVEVVVDTPSDKNTIYFKYRLGGLLIKSSVSFTHFIKNFKRKE